MLQTISNKLLNIFSNYTGTGKPFVTVLDYHTLENTGYPYLTFEPVEFRGEILDSCTNIRTYTFQILIFQEITETGGRQEAKEIITKSVDEITTILDQDFTLTDGVLQVLPVDGTISPVLINNGKALVCEMRVEIQAISSIR